jgi:hypothetical protein
MGRATSVLENQDEAMKWYGRSLEEDPANVRALSGRAVLLSRQGNHAEALAVLKGHSGDGWIQSLARKLQEKAEVYRRLERSEHIRAMVDDLVSEYRKQQEAGEAQALDPWTSRPVAVCFYEAESRGDPSYFEGEETLFIADLTAAMLNGTRFGVVEREELDRILEELRVATSELADPTSALRFGKLRAARALVETSMIRRNGTTTLTLKAIDSETTGICGISTTSVEGTITSETVRDVAQELASLLNRAFPIRGKIEEVHDQKVLLNVGGRWECGRAITFPSSLPGTGRGKWPR